MPYTFDAVGWEERNHDRHSGEPSDLTKTYSVLVRVTGTGDDKGDDHMFWAHGLERGEDHPWPFDSWAEWWLYIESMMEMYGMPLAS